MNFVRCLVLIAFLSASFGAVVSYELHLRQYNDKSHHTNQAYTNNPKDLVKPAFTLDINGSPLGVVINEIVSASADVTEKEAHEHADKDLEAQQGMANSTRWIVWLSALSCVFVGIGTWLLNNTLSLTRDATKAAQDAVKVTKEIGEKQARAYIVVNKAFVVKEGESFIFGIVVQNAGNTPANRISVTASSFEISDTKSMKVVNPEDIQVFNSLPVKSDMLLAIKAYSIEGDGLGFMNMKSENEDLYWQGFKNSENVDLVKGIVSYNHVFDINVVCETSFTFRYNGDGFNEKGHLKLRPVHQIETTT